MKRDDDAGAMPVKLAAEGASGGALHGASRGDLERGYTPLHGADRADPWDIPAPNEGAQEHNGLVDRPKNSLYTEHDAGGFLERAHGQER